MSREEYDNPAERLMVALENAVSRQLDHAIVLEAEAARARSEAKRLGQLAMAYGKLPANRLRPIALPQTAHSPAVDAGKAA